MGKAYVKVENHDPHQQIWTEWLRYDLKIEWKGPNMEVVGKKYMHSLDIKGNELNNYDMDEMSEIGDGDSGRKVKGHLEDGQARKIDFHFGIPSQSIRSLTIVCP